MNCLYFHFFFTDSLNRAKDAYDLLEAPALDWTPETGFSSSLLHENRFSYPRSPIDTGTDYGLNIILNASVEDYYCSSTNSYGFKIFMHNPIEAPKISYLGRLIMPGHETRVIVNPVITYSSKKIRSFSKRIRSCVFEGESHLEYFR